MNLKTTAAGLKKSLHMNMTIMSAQLSTDFETEADRERGSHINAAGVWRKRVFELLSTLHVRPRRFSPASMSLLGHTIH